MADRGDIAIAEPAAPNIIRRSPHAALFAVVSAGFALLALLAASDALAAVRTPPTPNPDYFIAPVLGWRFAKWSLLSFGFLGQALFSARVVVQVLASRARGESYTPPAFWYLSLGAGLMVGFYFYVRSDPVFLLQQVIMTFIYLRNIYMIRKQEKGDRFHRRSNMAIAILVGGACVSLLICTWVTPHSDSHLAHEPNPEFFVIPVLKTRTPAWPVLVFGFIGQAIFLSRFVTQWWASERAGRSVMPASFWFNAAVGSIMLLLYAIVRSDPIGILGQLFTMPAYLYNVALIRRKCLVASSAAQSGSVETRGVG